LLFNLRLTTHKCVYLVTCGHFWSRNKDGSYTIWSTVPKNPMLQANITALCLIECELLPIEVLHCGNRNFQDFWLLWPWPWPNDLYTWNQPVFSGDMPHVQIWTSYVKVFKSYHLTHTYVQTDICTDRQDQTYYTRHFAGGKKGEEKWKTTTMQQQQQNFGNVTS